MKLTKAVVTETKLLSFKLSVEDAPVILIDAFPTQPVFKLRPETIEGQWLETAAPEVRFVTVRGRVTNVRSEAHLTRMFALHDSAEPLYGAAPEWVFEALKEAGVEY